MYSKPFIKYYQKRILILMILSSLIFFIPVFSTFYKIAVSHITNAITSKNDSILQQLNSVYNTFNERLVKTTLEVFLDDRVQYFLYDDNINNVDEIAKYLNNYKYSTGLINKSIDSIVIYNGNINRYFTTNNDDKKIIEELDDFLSSYETISPMKPIFRKVKRPLRDNYTMNINLFSCFFYSYSDPVMRKDSFVLVNENAVQLLSKLASINQENGINNSVFLVNNSGVVYTNLNEINSSLKKPIIDDFLKLDKKQKNSMHYFYNSTGGGGGGGFTFFFFLPVFWFLIFKK
jgi:hypothetical protein